MTVHSWLDGEQMARCPKEMLAPVIAPTDTAGRAYGLRTITIPMRVIILIISSIVLITVLNLELRM